MVFYHTRHSFTLKNNQKASTDCAERCWMLYVPIRRHQQRRVIVQSHLRLIHTKSGLYKNMVMRFQSPLVYTSTET